MKLFNNLLIIALGAVLLFSCNKEHMGGDEQLPEGAVQISLSLPNVGPRSRADVHLDEENKTTDESRIKRATVLFYDHTNQTLTKKISTGEDGIKWNDAGKKVIVLAGKIDLTTPYDIVVLTNMPDAAALDGSITEGDARAKLNEVFSKLTSQIVLDDKHTLVMMGETKNHTFSKNITASVALAHQAVKIRVNLALTTKFAALYGALFTAATQPLRLTLYNVPNMSWITDNHASDDMFTRFTNLTAKTGYELLDYAPQTPKREAGANKWNITLYTYENVVNGVTADQQKLATSFVIQVPYVADGVEITENYYKVMIEDPQTASELGSKYKTVRNHLYDVNVGINGFGGPIASLDGVEAKTTVLPWGEVTSNVDTETTESISLSNTEFRLVGDFPDPTEEFLIARATFHQVDVKNAKAKLTITNGADAFDLVASEITVNDGVPVDVKIKNVRKSVVGTVRFAVGNVWREIKVVKKFDAMLTRFADFRTITCDPTATWCTVSNNETYTPGLGQSLTGLGDKWLHMDKTTMANDKRMANIYLTKSDTPSESDIRMVVIQRPYVEIDGVKWATGNVEIGHRPDGTMCYVIGGGSDYGLWFHWRKSIGFGHENTDLTPWFNDYSKHYIPNKDGGVMTATQGAYVDYTKISALDYDGTTAVIMNFTDPCEFLSVGDPAIRWKTPTGDQISDVKTKTKQWLNIENEQGASFNDHLFFRCNGGRDGNYNAMGVKTRWVESSGASRSTIYWSSTAQRGTGLTPGNDYAYALVVNSSLTGKKELIMTTANGVRCVRVN